VFQADEEFDTSYEGLLQLAASVGEAKPRSTPSHVISSMETAAYKDWATADSDKRCPICLDDVCVFSVILPASSLTCEQFAVHSH
jgi:hypothetical protein